MKTLSHLKRYAVAVLLVGFVVPVIAADRYNTIAGIVATWEANLGVGAVWETEFTEALNGASDAQLAEIQTATNYDAVRAILQGRAAPVELDGVTGTEALGDLTQDLVFTPVVPCRFFDTRDDSDTGSIGHTGGSTATIRSYQVYGDATLMQAQGGSVACDAPQGEPVGISANFTAAPLASPSSGKGNIRAYPSGGTLPGVSLVNYEAGTNIANAAIVATCYLCGFDLDVATRFHSSASIGDVMGYFYPATGPADVSYPVTMATDSAQWAQASTSNITINGAKISGDVAPGASVELKFDWVLVAAGGNVQQFYVGFDGGPADCFYSSHAAASGVYNKTIIAPTTSGPHRISIYRTWQISCNTSIMPANPIHGSTAGVVAVR